MIDFVIIALSLEEEKWKMNRYSFGIPETVVRRKPIFFRRKQMYQGSLYKNSLINNTVGVFIGVL